MSGREGTSEEGPSSRPPYLHRLVHRVLPVLAVLAAGAVGGLVALVLNPPVTGAVGPGEVEMKLRTALVGRTEIDVPPLGRVEADTHWTPSLVSAEVETVDVGELQQLLLVDQPTRRFVDIAERDFDRLARRLALTTLLAGLVGGAVAGALVPRRTWRRIALSATGGAIASGVVLGATWATFDTSAFSQPTYTGALARAPAVIETIGRHVDSFSAVQEQVDTLGHQLAELYAVAFADNPDRTRSGTRILHVSDVHSNPLAMEVVLELIESFDVHAVLDTGDLTSFGLPVEARIADQLADIGVPYLYVPGNHDSAQNRETIGNTPNVQLLDGDIAEVRGLRILGIADPTFTATNETTGPEGEEIVADFAAETARIVATHDPDVLAVHNEFQVSRSFGLVPLALNGHRHERQTEVAEGTIRLGVGSTGASGLGYFTIETDQPFEAQLLHLSRGCLRVQDYLRVRGISGDLEIQRRTFDLVPDPDSSTPRCVEPERPDTAALFRLRLDGPR